MAFIGEYEVAVTAGDRIVLPKKIRHEISGKSFVITKGFNVCLAGYDRLDWNKRTKSLLDVSLLESENIDKRRYIFSGANELSIDDQGRFIIPKSLADFMNLKTGTAVIVGVGDHFEIWDKLSWTKYLKNIKI